LAFTEYNANTWTTAELIADVRRRARISDDDQDYTDTVILREATDQIWTVLAPIEAKARDGRKIFESSRTVTGDSVLDGTDYVLPPMCSSDSISSVSWTDSTGVETALAVVSVDRQPDYSGEEGPPTSYALLDRALRLYPTPDGLTGTLTIRYPRRHPALVAATDARAVTAIATASSGLATKYTLSSAPPAEIAVGSWVDLVGARVPHHVHQGDAIVTAVSGSDVTVSVAYATSLAAVDATAARNWMQASGQTCFLMLPLEMRMPLAQLAAASILGQIGDKAGAQALEVSALTTLGVMKADLASRTKGTKEKIINHHSLMRSHGWRR
jgi:hypothetical protein